MWRGTKISKRRRKLVSKNSKDDIIKFFENLLDRRFSDAERVIKTISKKKFGDTEFKKGYVNALEGILLSYRSGDERDFFNRALFDKKSMRRYKKEFGNIVKKGVNSPFDIGFFSAWSDLIQYRLTSDKKS